MLPDRMRLYFDGSCWPNPGGKAGYAWRLENAEGDTVASEQGVVGRGDGMTNNVAEWAALTFALRYLASIKWRGSLAIYGDSKVVLDQLVGKYRSCKPHLRVWRDECRKILNNCRCRSKVFQAKCRCVGWEWSAAWIPREDNTECDQRSR